MVKKQVSVDWVWIGPVGNLSHDVKPPLWEGIVSLRSRIAPPATMMRWWHC